MELQGAWTGICYARSYLHLDHLIIESDSTSIIFWIQEARRSVPVHPLFWDIALLLQECSIYFVRHVYREANLAADWIASYVTNHSGEVLWTDLGDALGPLHDIVLSDFLGCIHSRFVR